MITSLSIAALKYVGVPFRHRGRSVRGLDCAGLLILAARDAGFEPKDRRFYGREPWNDGLREALQENLGTPVDREPTIDDVLLFTYRSGREPSHLGVVAPYPHGQLGLVHAYHEAGRVVYHGLTKDYLAKIVEVYPWVA